MNDLISREEVYKALTTAIDEQADIFDAVKAIPSADKHGEWRHYEGMLTCSHCGTEFYDDIMEYLGDAVPRFCPECGADMRKRDCGMVMADYVSNGDELHF